MNSLCLSGCPARGTLVVVLGPEHIDGLCKKDDLRCERALYLISIAGSAGAFGSLRHLLGRLPSDCPAALAVILHTGPRSVLVDALATCSRLPIAWATSDMGLQPGRVYAAPAGVHLIVNPDARLTVSEAPRVRLFRPSADWLFRSAAASFADRHIAIVLSGMMSDGAFSLSHVKRQGGIVIAQDPRTCRYPDMPRAALATGHVDAVLPIDDMPQTIMQVFGQRARQRDAVEWEDPFGPALAS
jgi:chemotaxis response regulator CheB